MMINIKALEEFISIPSVDGHPTGNSRAIAFITSKMTNTGFSCHIEGEDETDQPVLICHHPGKKSEQKIVIYGHYDVAPIEPTEAWNYGNPFTLKEASGRLYARGIADNKGPLWARMEAVADLLENEHQCPEILWLIQGEEEVTSGERVAKKIFARQIEAFGANVFIEETGFNNIDTGEQIAFLWSPTVSSEELSYWEPRLNKSLANPSIEFRHLNKFNGIDACPLLGNLLDDAVYIGFGPNDRLHRIHRKDESLNLEKLIRHKQQFKEFLKQYA